jgi:hypothetical protein
MTIGGLLCSYGWEISTIYIMDDYRRALEHEENMVWDMDIETHSPRTVVLLRGQEYFLVKGQ